MLAPRRRRTRRGLVMLEAAVVLPVLFLLILGLVVLGVGVYYYQQMASLAREGARYAAVHGANYAKDTGHSKATASGVYSAAILPMAVGLDPAQITYSVTWDDASQSPYYQTSAMSNTYRANYVNVTVNYAWSFQSFLGLSGRTLTLTSTSRMPMAN